MNKELPKAYEAKNYEDNIYQLWEESGFFNPDNLDPKGEPFIISMPPPNVTGILHLGHALENSLMDVEIRYQRMKGKRALLVPGTDHAAIATQARVEDREKKNGIDNPRQYYGREKLVEIIREYAEESKVTILGQIRKMGTSCDWSRLAYTFSDGCSTAVNELFFRMYKDGLIYRGDRVVNWSVAGQSTCSEEELEYKEQETTIYTFKYDKDFPITIATTRPETKLGDTAIAVHPDDERYKKYIGQELEADFCEQKLKIKVIADKEVDPEYGTGALGVTTAHSPIDYQMYLRNKEIGMIQVIGTDGKMMAAAGPDYEGLTVLEAREKVVKTLKEKGLIIKEEQTTHQVATSDRYKDVVEALPMKQWFLNVDKEIPKYKKTLKDLLREKLEEIDVKPEIFKKLYLERVNNLYDWCISRQIWWGHRIPVWYKDEEIKVQVENPGEGWTQDEDSLDTWFSSGAWTFSILGWPEQTKDLEQFHPNSWMQMGYEIIYLWWMRMVLFSAYALDEVPFKNLYVHGILRDRQGKKFSKSSGNGIDPLEVIEEYGADALRFSLLKGVAPGSDSRFYEDKVKDGRNFVNKLWNISRYILSKDIKETELKIETLAEKWIMSSQQNLIKDVTDLLDNYQFSLASEKIYDWMWHDLADWYLEINKKEKNDALLMYLLNNLLKLLHPFTPYVTEVLWREMHDDLLMVAKWPEVEEKYIDEKAEKEFKAWQKEEIKSRIKPEDLKKQMAKINEDIKATEKYIKQVEGRLKNENFVRNAPEAVVMEERERLEEAQKKLIELKEKKELYG